MAHMDTQLHSLDDIVSRIRAQNDVHHAAHTASLGALSSTVQSTYSSIGEHLSTSFTRVQSLESDMSAQVTSLKDTLPSLSEGAVPLHDLRDDIASRQLAEYQPTGETPQRVSYAIPSQLPRTEAHDSLLARLRGQPLPSDTTRSPTKQRPIFTDAPDSAETSPTETATKPDLTRAQSAQPALASGMVNTGPSLRELDVNIVSQESQTMPLALPSDLAAAAATGAPLKMKTKGGDADSKLPMKKMSRKTVAGGVAASQGPNDRENLTITSFSSSVGPGLVGGRRLRPRGSD